MISTPRQRLLDAKVLDAAVVSHRGEIGLETEASIPETNDVVSRNHNTKNRDDTRKRPSSVMNSRLAVQSLSEAPDSRPPEQELSEFTAVIQNAEQTLHDLGIWRQQLQKDEETMSSNQHESPERAGNCSDSTEPSTLIDVAQSTLSSSRNLAGRFEHRISQMEAAPVNSSITQSSVISSEIHPPPAPASRPSSVDAADDPTTPERTVRLRGLRMEFLLSGSDSAAPSPRHPSLPGSQNVLPTESASLSPKASSADFDPRSPTDSQLTAADPACSPETLLHRLRVRELLGEASAAPEARAKREAAEDAIRQQCIDEEERILSGSHFGLDLSAEAREYADELDDLLAQLSEDDDD